MWVKTSVSVMKACNRTRLYANLYLGQPSFYVLFKRISVSENE